jgi:hypothetical protein
LGGFIPPTDHGRRYLMLQVVFKDVDGNYWFVSGPDTDSVLPTIKAKTSLMDSEAIICCHMEEQA